MTDPTDVPPTLAERKESFWCRAYAVVDPALLALFASGLGVGLGMVATGSIGWGVALTGVGFVLGALTYWRWSDVAAIPMAPTPPEVRLPFRGHCCEAGYVAHPGECPWHDEHGNKRVRPW